MIYSYLQADPKITQEELKARYKKISRIVHPDKAPLGKESEYEEIFRRVESAYEILSSPVKRHLYDTYGDDGIDVYNNHREFFKHCINIEDSNKMFREVEKVYEGIRASKANFQILEKFERQSLKLNLHAILFTSGYKGKVLNPFNVLNVSSWSYRTTLLVKDWIRLNFVIDNNSDALSVDVPVSGNIFGHSVDFHFKKSLKELKQGSFSISKKFTNKVVGKVGLNFNGFIPSIIFSTTYNNSEKNYVLYADWRPSPENLFGSTFYASRYFSLSENLDYRVVSSMSFMHSTRIMHKLSYKVNEDLVLKLRMTNNKAWGDVFRVNYLSAGFTYDSSSSFKYTSSLYLRDAKIFGVKFGIRYHVIKVSVPINVFISGISEEIGALVCIAFLSAGLGYLKLIYSEDGGRVYEKGNIELQCEEFNVNNSVIHKEENEAERARRKIVQSNAGSRVEDGDITTQKAQNEEGEDHEATEGLILQASQAKILISLISDTTQEKDIQKELLSLKKELPSIKDSKDLASKLREARLSLTKKYTLSIDITDKMIDSVDEVGLYTENSTQLINRTLNPSLVERRSPVVQMVYTVNRRLYFAKYSLNEQISISSKRPISGIRNKLRNVFAPKLSRKVIKSE